MNLAVENLPETVRPTDRHPRTPCIFRQVCYNAPFLSKKRGRSDFDQDHGGNLDDSDAIKTDESTSWAGRLLAENTLPTACETSHFEGHSFRAQER